MKFTRYRGFTLVEMSVVLAVIGVVLGAMAIGKDLQRNASYQRLSTDFVQGWLVAYDSHVAVTGRVPGDSPTAPTGAVNATVATGGGNGTTLCDDPANLTSVTSLLNVFLAAGVALPQGRTEGQQNRYAYLDSHGNPQEVRVCFQSVMWAEPGATVGTYVSRPRNVMVLLGLTPSLAQMLDAQLDTQSDARFGRLREPGQANATGTTAGQPWSVDDRMAIGSTMATSHDESQVAVVNAYLLMNR